MKVERFEDLDVWKAGRELANLIYSYGHGGSLAKDYSFKDQIQRAAVSVMNNIAEGFERGSNKDFAKFLFIARGSTGEVRSMLYLTMDQKHITEEQFSEAYNLCVRESQLCWGLIKHLQKNSG
jgi:four helix bundle protein